jgi:glycosyltransferase involved in cell wall biosynthesis
MGRSKLAIIVPAYNEALSIGLVIDSIRGYGDVIVVDDGSLDETRDVAGAAGATEIVVHRSNRGYDAALASGFERAHACGYVFALTFDADGQHDPKEIPAFLSVLLGGSDMVVGVRGRKQRVAESIFGMFTRLVYGVADPLCGLKGYCLPSFQGKVPLWSYDSVGTELLIWALKKGKKVTQIPIRISDRADRPRFSRGLAANIKILKAMYAGVVGSSY